MFKSEIEARQTNVVGNNFTVHSIVSLAVEYGMIPSRSAFYEMTEKMQYVIINQMLPYAIEIFG